MKRALLFFVLFTIIFLIVSECGVNPELFHSWIDYVNVMFCNSSLSDAYGRPDFDIKVLMFNTLFLVFGVTCMFDQINLINKGFGSLIIIRFNNIRDYLYFAQKLCFKKIITYLAVVNSGFLIIMLICNSHSFISESYVISFSMLDIRYVAFFIVKLSLLFMVIGLLGIFLILEHKYEMVLSMSIIVSVFLLFLDTRIDSSFVSFSLNWKQMIFSLAYFLLYTACYIIISITLKHKEMW